MRIPPINEEKSLRTSYSYTAGAELSGYMENHPITKTLDTSIRVSVVAAQLIPAASVASAIRRGVLVEEVPARAERVVLLTACGRARVVEGAADDCGRGRGASVQPGQATVDAGAELQRLRLPTSALAASRTGVWKLQVVLRAPCAYVKFHHKNRRILMHRAHSLNSPAPYGG